MILCIDPGNIDSAFSILDETLRPIEFGKIPNESLVTELPDLLYRNKIDYVAIETVASYGMVVGKEVFETCFWAGRFWEICLTRMDLKDIKAVYRKEVKLNLCGATRAKDGNVIQALKDRFGQKGTKKSPGWFFGVSADVWQAIAVGVTYADMYTKKEGEEV